MNISNGIKLVLLSGLVCLGAMGCEDDGSQDSSAVTSVVESTPLVTENKILFVHGINIPDWAEDWIEQYMGPEWIDDEAEQKMDNFCDQLEYYMGVDVYRVSLPRDLAYNGTNAYHAQVIKDFIDNEMDLQPGEKIDIVAHSMGGLSARYYLKELGGDDKVDDYISLDTPQRGISWIKWYWWTVADLSPGSNLFQTLNGDPDDDVDECPGNTNYAAFFADYNAGSYLNCGEVNYEFFGLPHMDFLTDILVLSTAINILRN